MYCKCWKVLSVKVAISHLIDECIEYAKSPCTDEFSDMCFATGRLLGAISGKEYVHVIGDKNHVDKINARFAEHGCIRSKNHRCGE